MADSIIFLSANNRMTDPWNDRVGALQNSPMFTRWMDELSRGTIISPISRMAECLTTLWNLDPLNVWFTDLLNVQMMTPHNGPSTNWLHHCFTEWHIVLTPILPNCRSAEWTISLVAAWQIRRVAQLVISRLSYPWDRTQIPRIANHESPNDWLGILRPSNGDFAVSCMCSSAELLNDRSPEWPLAALQNNKIPYSPNTSFLE